MVLDEELCPLITEYTREQNIPDDLLEQLFVLRNWDIDGVKAGTVKPIPFKWPTLLRKQIMFKGQLTPLDIREYQKQQIHHMCRMPRFINGDGVGLGKTLDTLASMCWLKDRHPDLKFIILTTKSTSFQWATETEHFSELRPFVIQDKYRGSKSYDARLQQVRDFIAGDKKDVLICKYTSLIGSRKKTQAQFDDDGNPIRGGQEHVSPETREFCSILKQNKGRIVLVLDESQKFKNQDSQIRKLVSGAASCSGRVWALSATVIKNDLKEFYSIAHAIGIRPFGSVWEWEHEFAVLNEQYVGNGQTKTVIRGYIPSKVVEFKAGMRPYFLGRSQRQVKEPLPQLTTVYHPIELDEKQTRLLLQDIPSGAYELPPSVVRQAGELIVRERDPDNKMTMLAVYQLVANHPCLLDPSNRTEFFTKKLSPKEEALLDLLDGDLRGEKVICFAQPLDAKVLTPSGWKMMGELKVGDEVVDPDGGTGFVEGVYPQGEKDIFEVTTKSHARTRATADHLWLVGSNSGSRGRRWRVRTTQKIAEKGLKRSYKNGTSYNKAFLPIAAVSQFATADKLEIPPYTLGALLGDGHIKNYSASICSIDQEIPDKIQSELLPDVRIVRRNIEFCLVATNSYEKDNRGFNLPRNPYIKELRRLGLMDKGSAEKFIPDSYLCASIKDRKELLKGLLDTDGCCDKRGYVKFSTCSPQLARGVAELVRSLGGLAYFDENNPQPTSYVNKDGDRVHCLPGWDVNINVDFNPFHLARKADRWKSASMLNPISSIEKVGTAECQCIEVSTKRSLYITDDYIVTHNTKSRTWIDRFQRITADGNFSTRKFLRITGSENEKKREENKQLFQTSDDHDLIYINAAALEGVNLQQAAHMIMLDCPWSWGDLLQLVGRMVRMASPHSACTLHVLTAKGTIDEYTLEVLRTKKNIFECILGESHSSGILGGVTLNLGSGMEEVGSEEEFASMLKAHMRSVSMGTFIQGEKLTEAVQEGENYVMAHEGKKGRKPKTTFKFSDVAKWDLE
jgi:SNF2-related domain/Helicase conserved C-terminal domain/LAGLIDADG-like domain